MLRSHDIDALADQLHRLAAQLQPAEIGPRTRLGLAAREALERIRAGADVGTALALAAYAHGADLYTLGRYLRHTAAVAAAQETWARAWTADAMARAGYSRSDIAAVVGCHPNHVPRLRKKIAAWRADHTAMTQCSENVGLVDQAEP